MKWSQNVGAVSHIGVSPLASTMVTGSMNCQLIIQYNTEYNVSVVAVTPCGNLTASISLHYGEIYVS